MARHGSGHAGGAIAFFSLETHRPTRAFDVVAFSLSSEVGHTNLLNCLDLAGVPLHACDRTDADPLVMIGGHAAFNPEPLAPFVDVVCAGDGEEFVLEVDAVLQRRARRRLGPRRDCCDAVAAVEGAYLPDRFARSTSRRTRGRPTASSAGRSRPRRRLRTACPSGRCTDLDAWPYPKTPLVPLTETVHERYASRSSAAAPAAAASARRG